MTNDRPGDMPPLDFDGTLATLGQEARFAIERLAIDLRQRDLFDDWKQASADRVVSAALGQIDRLATEVRDLLAENQRLRAQVNEVEDVGGAELEAVFDGGLTVEQEIVAEALAVASRILAGSLTRYADPDSVTAAGDAAVALAGRFEARIRDAEASGVVS